MGLLALLDRGVPSPHEEATRNYVWMVVAAVVGLIYSCISRDWSAVAFYGGFAGVVVLVVGIGLPWLEFAPDGAFRKRSQT